MKSIMKLAALLSILVACSPATPLATVTPAPTPSSTPIPSKTSIPSDTPTLIPTITPTFTITPTSTPQPPLTDHEWYPNSILVSMFETYGDGGTVIGDLGTRWFILYADGSLFVNHLIAINDTYQYQYLTKKLNRQEICQHLNTFDQVGFLDYNPSDYTFIGGKSYGIGAGDFLIRVNAWKSKDDSYYDLGFYLRQDIIKDLYGQTGYPIISPALRKTYYFLSLYPEVGLEVYKPDRLAVWITPANYLSSDYESTAQSWGLNTPSLRKLLQQSSIFIQGSEEKYIELHGSEAKAVYAYLGSTDAVHIFEQTMPDSTKQYFALTARPLLPYEKIELNNDRMSDLTVPSSERSSFKISCHPSDGILPIPTPPNP